MRQIDKKGFTPTPNTSLSKSGDLGNKKKKDLVRGFTLLELLIVVSVLLVLVSIVVSPFSSFRNRSLLNIEVENITTLINNARSKTLSSYNDSEYGVHFEANRVVFFKGTSFVEPDVNNIEIVFNTAIYISDISLVGGGSNLVFNRLTGKTDENGTITVALTSASTTNNVISIYATGSTEID